MTTTASDHVEDSSSSHTAANDQADDLIELCKCERGAKNVEERLEKEWVDKSAVFHHVALLDENSQEKESEEYIVAFNHDGIQLERTVFDCNDRKNDGQSAESDR